MKFGAGRGAGRLVGAGGVRERRRPSLSRRSASGPKSTSR